MPYHGQRILVVDDEPNIANSLVKVLQTKGFEAVAAHSGESAIATASTFLPDIAILDVKLGGLDGIDAASMIVFQRPSCRIVLFSGNPETTKLVESGEVPFEILAKPVPPEKLLQHLATLQPPQPPPGD